MQNSLQLSSPSFLLVVATVFASLFAFSALKTPVPGSDEPHYLTKSRHYWDPGWCDRDLFLQSADAHLVFYQTIGSLTRVFTFAQTAWIGRVLAFAVVAVGWTAMVSRLVSGGGGEYSAGWSALWALWAYLLLSTLGSFSREWIIEGVEAKVFAYGFVFIGLAFAFDRSWLWAAAAFGTATSFHPVVGGWSVLCALLATGLRAPRSAVSPHSALHRAPPLGGRHPAFLLLAAAIVFLLCALPGLLPAVRLLSDGASPETAVEGDSIQVFGRLAHHLNPERFGMTAYALYGALSAFWLWARRGARLGSNEQFFAWFVVGSILVAGAGLLIGWNAQPPSDPVAGERTLAVLRAKFLKVYPFRLFDAVMPIAVAVVVAGWAGRIQREKGRSEEEQKNGSHSSFASVLPAILPSVIFGAAFVAAMWIPSIHHNPSGLTPRQLADFKDVCGWIESNTPPDSLFLTPAGKAPFKWYARRAEWFSYKDCPQDSASLVEWNRRLEYLRRWATANWTGGYSREEVAQFQSDTGIDYILAQGLGPFDDAPVYHNASFRVYRLNDAETP